MRSSLTTLYTTFNYQIRKQTKNQNNNITFFSCFSLFNFHLSSSIITFRIKKHDVIHCLVKKVMAVIQVSIPYKHHHHHLQVVVPIHQYLAYLQHHHKHQHHQHYQMVEIVIIKEDLQVHFYIRIMQDFLLCDNNNLLTRLNALHNLKSITIFFYFTFFIYVFLFFFYRRPSKTQLNLMAIIMVVFIYVQLVQVLHLP